MIDVEIREPVNIGIVKPDLLLELDGAKALLIVGELKKDKIKRTGASCCGWCTRTD